VFSNAELSQDLVEQPVADLGIAVRRDRRGASVRVLPPSVTALLAGSFKAKLTKPPARGLVL